MNDKTIFKLLEDVGIDPYNCTLDQINAVEYLLEKIDNTSIIPLETDTSSIIDMYYNSGLSLTSIAVLKKTTVSAIAELINNVKELVKISPYVKYGLTKYFTMQRHMKAEREREERERKLHEIINELSRATEQIDHGDVPSSVDNSILTTNDILSIIKAIIDEDEKKNKNIIIRKIKIS